MCEAIYIGNTQHISKKIMDSHFSDLLRLLKNGKIRLACYHFEQLFKYTMSRTYLRTCMPFKVVNQINHISAMKTFMKPNYNLCMEERLTTLKKLRDKHVTVMNMSSEIYRPCQNKTTFRRFCLSTDDTV